MTVGLVASVVVSLSGSANVVDGDTLRIGKERIRLSGIDAPELSQSCGIGDRRIACGLMSAAWLRARIGGRELNCVSSERDRYGRLVAVCRLNGKDVGAAMVDAGWATAYRRYSMAYVGNELRAKTGRIGIWATDFEQPADYRKGRRLAVAVQLPPNSKCAIKGNISTTGVRIFHLPGTRAYQEVRIDQQRGERWFCTTHDAMSAGWRAVR